MLFHLPYFVANGIYSNGLGFWGGITCALLVAKVFRDHPGETDAVKLVKLFFSTFSHWYAISMSCFQYITVGSTMNMI